MTHMYVLQGSPTPKTCASFNRRLLNKAWCGCCVFEDACPAPKTSLTPYSGCPSACLRTSRLVGKAGDVRQFNAQLTVVTRSACLMQGGQGQGQSGRVKGKRAAQASGPGGWDRAVRQHAATAADTQGRGKGRGTQQPGNGPASQQASQGQHSLQGGTALGEALGADSTDLATRQGPRPGTSPRPHLLPLPTPGFPGAPRSPRLKTSGASSASGPPSARSAASPTPMPQKGSLVRVTATPGERRGGR